jgi:phosphoribosylaminoimidazolecarboxamide formyltransferase/IMP cyclohydrolase
VALSDRVDVPTAELLRREVSDGVIAPGYEEGALAILGKKKNGQYAVLEMDAAYEPPPQETREVFGVTLEQKRNDFLPRVDSLGDVVTREKELPDAARRDLTVALIALKYTQSNSVCLAVDGQVIGMGAGQQSRIHCTRLASSKADTWFLRQHPAVLDLPFRPGLARPDRDNAIDGFLRDDLSPAEERDWLKAFERPPTRLTPEERRAWLDQMGEVALGSDAFIPFRDNVDRASRSGVKYIVQPGGSVRDEDVVAACDEYGMVMVCNRTRLFHH